MKIFNILLVSIDLSMKFVLNGVCTKFPIFGVSAPNPIDNLYKFVAKLSRKIRLNFLRVLEKMEVYIKIIRKFKNVP